jgi:hypothetical protein
LRKPASSNALNGSTATQASIEYIPDRLVRVASGTIINAAVVRMTGAGNTGLAMQNGTDDDERLEDGAVQLGDPVRLVCL